MTAVLAVVLGALWRRWFGWGPVDRTFVLLMGAMLALWILRAGDVADAAALPMALAVTIGWMPGHGQFFPHGGDVGRAVEMALRYGAVSVVAALAGWAFDHAGALVYAPAGLAAGPIYWAAFRWQDRLPWIRWPVDRPILDAPIGWAELGLGAVMFGGLLLV